jgi:hypothetical protein
MDEQERQPPRLESELRMRDLTPEEIQNILEHAKQVERVARQLYPKYFTPGAKQPES